MTQYLSACITILPKQTVQCLYSLGSVCRYLYVGSDDLSQSFLELKYFEVSGDLLLLTKNNRGCSFILHTNMYISIALTPLHSLISLFLCCLQEYLNIKKLKVKCDCINSCEFSACPSQVARCDQSYPFLFFPYQASEFLQEKKKGGGGRVKKQNRLYKPYSFAVPLDCLCTVNILPSLPIGG